MEKECEACGKTFTVTHKRRKYCDECKAHGNPFYIKRSYDMASIRTHKYDVREPTVFTIECEECGKQMRSTASTHGKYRYYVNGKVHHFCEEKCFNNYRKTHRYCYQCNKHLDNPTILGWTNDMCFCSEECQFKYADAVKMLKVCQHCGKKFIRKTGWFCSQKCSNEARKNGWVRPEPKFEDDWF